jgi:hypothetical protein
MPSLTSQQEKELMAFVSALAQQDESLPPGLQKQLHAIGQNLEARVVELPVIAASLPSLNQTYQAALADAQTPEGEKGATLVSTQENSSTKLRERAVQIFTDPDPVQAAQRRPSQRLGPMASNPLKRLFGRG